MARFASVASLATAAKPYSKLAKLAKLAKQIIWLILFLSGAKKQKKPLLAIASRGKNLQIFI